MTLDFKASQKKGSEDTGLHFRSDTRADGHGAAVDIQAVASFLWLALAGNPVESRGPECGSGCQGGRKKMKEDLKSDFRSRMLMAVHDWCLWRCCP